RYSTNFGQTWSASINLSNSLASYLNQGVNIQTGPNGEVYAAWAVYIDGSVSTGEDGIGFAKSTNGGLTWSTPIYAYQATNFGMRGTLSNKNGIRVASFPSMAVDRSGGPNNGTIYITWPQDDVAPAGNDPDIVVTKSTDGGTTWAAPIRVNDDALNNAKDQYYPWCTVDQSTGQFMIVFYDSRNVPNNQAEVFMARSLDGGNTFENFQVSDQPHTPQPISGLAGGYAGDYIGVAALNDVAYPFWADNRLGTDHYQAWTALVSFGPPCPIDPPSNPNPPSGATGVPISGNTATWTNGVGATQIELWFGEVGSLTQVYMGAPITSFSLAPVEPLSYNTTYGWQVIGKNDTCNVAGPVWTFTTMQDPNLIVAFNDPFNNLTCWTPIGPLGLTNWSLNTSTNAGGSPPTELELSWTPSFNGLSKLLSCTINSSTLYINTVTLKHFLDYFGTPAPFLGLGVTYDAGTTVNTLWEFQATGNVGPEDIEVTFTPTQNDYQLVLYCNGNSFNIDFWYIDDVIVYYIVPVELTSFTASSVSDEVTLNWAT
ncbi:MAG: sialidase family protein, partial [Ignavibacteriaceae bacterium]